MLKDQNVENQNIKKNVESLKMTFDVLIFLDAIGNIRTSKVLVHFLDKNTFNILILPMASEMIRTSKIKKINYLWRSTYVYQGLWGIR
jgi:DNA polymerase III sliding clamp (beta) subunit (PCNA family)